MKILCIGAHYDDLELSAGGTIARFCKEGHEVFVNVVTASDYTNYNGEVLRDKWEAEKEGINALKILGIKEYKIKCLNYETKKVPFNYQLIEDINRSIETTKPNLIITHSLASSHQDHINTAKSTMAAARRCKNIWMYEPIYPDKITNNPFKPIIYINITDTFNIKLDSLKAHINQFKKYPEWTELVTNLAKFRGIENGIINSLAESFEPIKMEYII